MAVEHLTGLLRRGVKKPAKNSKFWTEKLVIDCVRALHRNGRPLNQKAVSKDNSIETREILLEITGRETNGLGVYQAALKRCGGWDAALRDAGIDPRLIRTDLYVQRPHLIVDGIRALHRAGVPLYTNSIHKNRSERTRQILKKELGIESNGTRIFQAAWRRYGSWNTALREAGIEPESVKRCLYFWSRDKIVACIASLAKEDITLHTGAIAFDDSPRTHKIIQNHTGKNTSGRALLTAAREYFGSWDKALEASGVPPVTVRKTRVWTKELVQSAIRSISIAGLPLDFVSISREHCSSTRGILRQVTQRNTTGASLCAAGIKFFGTWTNALEASGLPAASIRRDRVWNRESVVKALSVLDEHKFPLNASSMNREKSAGVSNLLLGITGRMTTGSSMYQAARVIFSSWDAALRQARLDPCQIRRRSMSLSSEQELVVRILLLLQAEGVALNYSSLIKRTPAIKFLTCKALEEVYSGWSILRGATKAVGTWDKALIAAGFDPFEIRRRGPSYSRLAHASFQRERINTPDGVRLVTYLGEPPKAADALLEREHLSHHMQEAIEGIDPSLRLAARQIFDLVETAGESLDQQSLIRYIEESTNGAIDRNTACAVFSELAAHPILSDYRD